VLQRETLVRSLNGLVFYTLAEVCELAGMTRQTFWRWRSEGRVPSGTRFRDRQLLFSTSEVEVIKEYSNRMQPAVAVRSFQ